MLKSKRISIVAALDRNRLIGRGNALPWRLPADLARFKAITWGHPILMGRRTFESLGRPLPGRTNIVLSRAPAFRAEGAVVVHGLDQALAAAGEAEEVFVIGGASFYAQCLPLAQRMYLTRVDAEFEGDAWFPAFDAGEWREVAREAYEPDPRNPHPYTFLVLERRREAD